MTFQVRFLGTGNAFSRFADNYHNNAVVLGPEGFRSVLIDCGATAPQALHELGIKPWDVRSVIITHLHGDHCGGLEQLIWERYYTGPSGPGFLRTPIFVHPDLEVDLTSYLNPVLNPYTRSDGGMGVDWRRELVDIVATDFFVQNGVTFTLTRTPHVRGEHVDKPSCGIVMADAERSHAYFSGDTTFVRDNVIARAAEGIVFHECTFMPRYPGTVHTHYEELLTLPEGIRKMIVLMHYGVVPAGVDPVADGFRAAAKRGETFDVTGA